LLLYVLHMRVQVRGARGWMPSTCWWDLYWAPGWFPSHHVSLKHVSPYCPSLVGYYQKVKHSELKATVMLSNEIIRNPIWVSSGHLWATTDAADCRCPTEQAKFYATEVLFTTLKSKAFYDLVGYSCTNSFLDPSADFWKFEAYDLAPKNLNRTGFVSWVLATKDATFCTTSIRGPIKCCEPG
jgi:hypothetical protein